MERIKCIGCGSTIQSDDIKSPGYVPQSKLETTTEDIVCRRCFRLKNYNEVTPLSITKDDYFNIISQIGNENALIVKIIDIFDIEGSLIPQISKLTNHNDLVVIANKVDLLPKSVKENKLLHHLKRIMSENNIRPLDIHIMSAKKYHNIDHVMESIVEKAKNRNIYITGATNVGKSTFINALLKAYADSSKDVITVSPTAGTTLDLIQIPFGNHFIIDTPGLINENQITHYLSQKALKIVTPKKEIKPSSYQLNSGQTLFLGGVARLDFVNGDKTSFIVYVSEMMKIHRTKTINADHLYDTQRTKVLTPPFEGEKVFDLEKHTFKINDKGKQDIVLPGIGFITTKGPISINVYVKKGTTPYVRGALI